MRIMESELKYIAAKVENMIEMVSLQAAKIITVSTSSV